MYKRSTPVLLLPFTALWGLFALIIKLTGRLVAAVLGLALMVVGLVLCITVVGFIVGGPLILFGFLLMVRGFF